MSEGFAARDGCRELKDIREDLDDVDRQILDLFIKRQDLVKEVAGYKIKNGMPVLRQDREDEILARIRGAAGDEYGGAAVSLFEEIMKSSRDLQHRIMEEL